MYESMYSASVGGQRRSPVIAGLRAVRTAVDRAFICTGYDTGWHTA